MNTTNLPENRLSVNVLYYMDLLILLNFPLSFCHRFEGCTFVRQKRVWLDMERKAWAIKASKHEIKLPILELVSLKWTFYIKLLPGSFKMP